MPPDPSLILARVCVVPVLTVEQESQAVPLARALVAGGLPVIEVTLRTPAALAAIRAIAAEVPDAVVGAGTVTKPADIDAALKAGARYLVSPGTSADMAAAFAQSGVPVLPGCQTVSEALALAERGFKVLKFFPAEAAGGVSWLKSVAAPLPSITFCPTGGIDGRNAAVYLALPNVVVVGGSWVAPRDLLDAGEFARITALAHEAAALRP